MADEGRGDAVEVTPAEARFLHRFVRRTVLPWIAGVGALGALALGVALSPTPPAGPIAVESDAPGFAAQEELRAEIASLRSELAALRSATGQATQAGDDDARRLREQTEAAERSARSLEARLRDELVPRLAKLESELAALPAPREVGSVPSAGSLGDLASIRDRLYNVEMRQDRKEQERAALQQDVLARLYQLEQSVQSESAARLDNLRTGEHRLHRLELRLSDLEGLPAAPAPASSPR